jgi:hypothetical protein
MKRKFIGAMLFGALIVSSAGVFVSCSDYDDDISNLQEQIDANAKAIEQINSLITSGSVIVDVVEDGNGIIVKLSNGREYPITNGQNGSSAVVWKIGEDGFWYKDGVKTDYYALGKDGKDGKDGINGADGKDGVNGADGKDGQDGKDGVNGADGKDGQDGQDGVNGTDGKDGQNGKDGVNGDYYVPDTDGFFHLMQWNAATGKYDDKGSTGIKWQGSGISAAMTNDDLILTGVSGATDGTVVISLSNSIRGLVFVPEAYVDGVPAIKMMSYSYNARTVQNQDKEAETAPTGTKKTVVNPTTYATYHVNPANAKLDDVVKNLSFVVEKDKEFFVTRGAASSDFAVKAEYDKEKSGNGKLVVKVNVTGTPATAEKISVVALQAKKGNDEVITSDYATIYKSDYKDMRIINTKVTGDYHYRRYMSSLDTESGLPTEKVWDVNGKTDKNVELVYTKKIDLKDYVGVHELTSPNHTKLTADKMESLGFSFKFELVKNYKIGSNNTDQGAFVDLSGSELSVKDIYGSSAIDRTPIIRVMLMHGAEKVEVAYVKVKIVREGAPIAENPSYPLDVNPFKFSCSSANVSNSTTYEQMNQQIYKVLNMSKTEFHNKYSTFTDLVWATMTADQKRDVADAQKDLGTVEEINSGDNMTEEGTHVLKWTISQQDLWNHAGETVTNVVAFTSTSGATVYITLKATIDQVTKVYDVAKPNYITNYWTVIDGTDYAQFNVQLPQSTSDDNASHCVFVNDLNALFKTDANGIIVLNNNVTEVKYTFHSSMSGSHKFGNVTKTFTLKNGDTELWVGNELIASIKNDGTGVDVMNPVNGITLNKNSNTAKELLNSDKFSVKISATGYVCSDQTKSVKITFDGKDYFETMYVRPVYLSDVSAEKFTDGVDLGDKGSYIKVDGLINPYDFRNRYFKDYDNYWGYYGPFTVVPDLKNAQCDLNGTKAKIPVSLQLAKVATVNDETATYGFITYKNNGNIVNKGFNIFIDVKVNYGWGTITKEITVPVEPGL